MLSFKKDFIYQFLICLSITSKQKHKRFVNNCHKNLNLPSVEIGWVVFSGHS